MHSCEFVHFISQRPVSGLFQCSCSFACCCLVSFFLPLLTPPLPCLLGPSRLSMLQAISESADIVRNGQVALRASDWKCDPVYTPSLATLKMPADTRTAMEGIIPNTHGAWCVSIHNDTDKAPPHNNGYTHAGIVHGKCMHLYKHKSTPLFLVVSIQRPLGDTIAHLVQMKNKL